MGTDNNAAPLQGDDDLLTKTEAAAFLRLSTKTVEQMIYRGRITAYRVAGRLRIPRSSLIEALTQKKLADKVAPKKRVAV